VSAVAGRVSNTQAEAGKMRANPVMSAGVGTSPRIKKV
jgi:hypothetical protein